MEASHGSRRVCVCIPPSHAHARESAQPGKVVATIGQCAPGGFVRQFVNLLSVFHRFTCVSKERSSDGSLHNMMAWRSKLAWVVRRFVTTVVGFRTLVLHSGDRSMQFHIWPVLAHRHMSPDAHQWSGGECVGMLPLGSSPGILSGGRN